MAFEAAAVSAALAFSSLSSPVPAPMGGADPNPVLLRPAAPLGGLRVETLTVSCPPQERPCSAFAEVHAAELAGVLRAVPAFLKRHPVRILWWMILPPGASPNGEGGRAALVVSAAPRDMPRVLVHELAHSVAAEERDLYERYLALRFRTPAFEEALRRGEPLKLPRRGAGDERARVDEEYWAISVELYFTLAGDRARLERHLSREEISFLAALFTGSSTRNP